MRRYAVLILTLTFAVTLMAASLRLYLKDGGFQIVREYKVDADKITYYSVERSDWEEMPVALVDLKKTEAEASAKKAVVAKQAKELDEEDEALKEQRREILKIPTDPGVYRVVNDELQIFKQADMIMHNNKGRNVLKALSPIPMVAGKATIEVAGAHSSMVLRDEPRPEFYMQLSLQDSLALVKVTSKDDVRTVERIRIEPVVNIITEERDSVEVFSKQLTESGLYKIWPQDDLPKGEYALIEYDERKANPRIWDFRIE